MRRSGNARGHTSGVFANSRQADELVGLPRRNRTENPSKISGGGCGALSFSFDCSRPVEATEARRGAAGKASASACSCARRRFFESTEEAREGATPSAAAALDAGSLGSFGRQRSVEATEEARGSSTRASSSRRCRRRGSSWSAKSAEGDAEVAEEAAEEVDGSKWTLCQEVMERRVQQIGARQNSTGNVGASELQKALAGAERAEAEEEAGGAHSWCFLSLANSQPGGGHIVERSELLPGAVVGHGGVVAAEETEHGRRNKGHTLLLLLH